MKSYWPGCKEPLDLTSDVLPPEDRHIQIRVRDEGVGEIVTQDSGTVKLKKGWVHMVRRADVETLIRAGKIEHMGSARADDMGAPIGYIKFAIVHPENRRILSCFFFFIGCLLRCFLVPRFTSN